MPGFELTFRFGLNYGLPPLRVGSGFLAGCVENRLLQVSAATALLQVPRTSQKASPEVCLRALKQ